MLLYEITVGSRSLSSDGTESKPGLNLLPCQRIASDILGLDSFGNKSQFSELASATAGAAILKSIKQNPKISLQTFLSL